MNANQKFINIAGWLVFAIAMTVYFFSAERVGSLWDCGEFILGAYKLQVVHPPGAPLFLLIGHIFTYVADIFSDDPADIAFAVNLLSGACTAFTAAFVTWITIRVAQYVDFNNNEEQTSDRSLIYCGAGLVAGLATTFCSSIWFSAVEGEVYAMSTMFTAMTLWSMIKWYTLPDSPQNDRWIILTVYLAGLSIGVHLLSLLTFPALALLYYFKKYPKNNLLGAVAAMGVGVVLIGVIQKFIIEGLPLLWTKFELLAVNSFNMPIHSGLIFLAAVLIGLLFAGLRFARTKNNRILEIIVTCAMLLVISYSTIGVVLVRANADPPVNMNDPEDAFRLLPYINREQYGERPLLRGPHYEASPYDMETTPRYGRVGDKYEIVDRKITALYRDKDKMFFPRMSHTDQGRPGLYRKWTGAKPGKIEGNIGFFVRYQISWMYWRYFNWNFIGRQNGEQGYEPWNLKSGHWLSGIKPIDEARLYNMDELPRAMAENQAYNKYYFLPLLFGLFGMFWLFKRDPKIFMSLLIMFLITGIGIIIYSNQPPNEPRERDYVLVGSFFTFCIWIGLGAMGVFNMAKKKLNLGFMPAAGLATVLALSAPIIMGFQNWDDHSRKNHTASRDYASNFLESCRPNSIIFTYGDNDTYPLWYAQEVEGIRTDVRVVNLSLIAVDWYIDGLRRKVNDSPALKFSLPKESLRGYKRNAVYHTNQGQPDRELSLGAALKFIGESHPVSGGNGNTFESFLPSKKLYIPIDKNRMIKNGVVELADSANIVSKIPINIKGNYIQKDELAVLDIINNNIYDRPIYFSVTCQNEKLQGLNDYMELEGAGLRIIPVKTPSQKELYIYGSGRVNTEVMYDNIMNKFRWGNFDKEELFVSKSYGASLQAWRMIMVRLANTLYNEGKTDMAKNIANKYFEAFPNMNFTYDSKVMPMITVLLRANAFEDAKKHMRILANETSEHLNFYYSLDADDIKSGFESDFAYANDIKDNLLQVAKSLGDKDFESEMNNLLGAYVIQNVPN